MKKQKKKKKIERLPPEAKEEPKILQHSKYEDEPALKKTKSRYDEEEI